MPKRIRGWRIKIELDGWGGPTLGVKGAAVNLRPQATKAFDKTTVVITFTDSGWGRSSVGRAPQWHCGGQGFESPRLHHVQHQALRFNMVESNNGK